MKIAKGNICENVNNCETQVSGVWVSFLVFSVLVCQLHMKSHKDSQCLGGSERGESPT